MTWFLYAGRKLLGFIAGIEIDVVLVWLVQIDMVYVGGAELDLISV